MKPSYTPGPLEVGGDYDTLVLKDGDAICVVQVRGAVDLPEARANARLIAAVPELADALAEMLRGATASACAHGSEHLKMCADCKARHKKARAALKKAGVLP